LDYFFLIGKKAKYFLLAPIEMESGTILPNKPNLSASNSFPKKSFKLETQN